MAQHVILLTDAYEPPSDALTDALRGAGVAAFVEVLRETAVISDPASTENVEQLPRHFAPAPLAVLYEVVPGTDMVEVYGAVEHATSNWPGTPIVACRQPFAASFRHNFRILESSTLRRLGFRAIADEPAQLPALLRELEERGNSGELRNPSALVNPFLLGLSLLPAKLTVGLMRASFELVASLHFSTDQRSAAYTALEGIRRLVRADQWTIYLTTDSSASTNVILEPLAIRHSDANEGRANDGDWRRLLLSDAMVTSGPVSQAASEAVSILDKVSRREGKTWVLAIPLISGERVMGVLEAVRVGSGRMAFKKAEAELLDALTSPIASALANSQRIAEAERLSQTDDLTKLHNARYLRQFLLSEVKRARRYGSAVSAVFLDLDDFKQVNDVHGHLVGSHVLMETATVILSSVRDTDVIARYGGDEFVVILPETAEDQAHHVASRVRENLAKNLFTGGRRLDLRLTASFGVASFPKHAQSPQQLIACADTAMYEAKAAGKDRVCISTSPASIYSDEKAVSQ
jgi:diguanylate cyclase (GGDEF)-like protein